MRELKRRNQPLCFKCGKRTLLAGGDRITQLFQRLAIVGEALLPADIEIIHYEDARTTGFDRS